MNRQDLRAKLTSSLGSAAIQNHSLVEILCDYTLELQDVLKRLEYAYEIVTGEDSRTEKYFLFRKLAECILLDEKNGVLEAVEELKKESHGR